MVCGRSQYLQEIVELHGSWMELYATYNLHCGFEDLHFCLLIFFPCFYFHRKVWLDFVLFCCLVWFFFFLIIHFSILRNTLEYQIPFNREVYKTTNANDTQALGSFLVFSVLSFHPNYRVTRSSY